MAVKARYTEQVVVMVTPEVRQRLDAVADRDDVSVAQVVRDCIDLAIIQRAGGNE